MYLLHNLTNNLKVGILYFNLYNFFSSEFAEADTFFCFSHIMVEIGDKFNKALDSSPTGYSKHVESCYLYYCTWYYAESALNTMMMLLKRKDAVLYENLVWAVLLFSPRWCDLFIVLVHR